MLRHNGKILICFEKRKNDFWNKTWQLTSFFLNLQTINQPSKFQIEFIE